VRIYLDYNATAPLDPAVSAAMAPLAGVFGNASSIHWAGREARRHLEAARTALATRTGRKPSEVIFTSGGSEANNLALRGTLGPLPRRRRLITSAVEHPSVRVTAEALAKTGVEHREIPVDREGRLDLGALEEALAGPPAVVSVMAVNNETGVLSPIPEIHALTKAAGALLHVDAVQAVGRVPVAWQAELISISGHKLGAPKGAGALLRQSSIALEPLIHGGPQERGFRAGTEPVATFAGLAAAVERSIDRQAAEVARLRQLQVQLEAGLRELGAEIVGAGAPRAANTTLFTLEGLEAESLLQALDLEGIAASSGSACSSGSVEPSPVLLAMGRSQGQARSAIRVSTGLGTVREDIDALLLVLPGLLARVRAAGPLR